MIALFLFFTDKNVKKLMGQIHFQLIIKQSMHFASGIIHLYSQGRAEKNINMHLCLFSFLSFFIILFSFDIKIQLPTDLIFILYRFISYFS